MSSQPIELKSALPSDDRHMGAGSFFGAVRARREQCGAIFTDLRHSTGRKLPSHSHELPFFALLLEGFYAERYGGRESQYGPFTVMFRPAGVPHQDEIGPSGLRFFEIELRPIWDQRLAEYSNKTGNPGLDIAREELGAGPLLWLALKLFREITAGGKTDDLTVDSLLCEILTAAEPRPSKQTPQWLPRILDKLKAEHSRRLTLDELAAVAGVHPVHLSRVFRRSAGEGLSDYVHRLRVRSACERMQNPEVTLADLSFSTGFADQSHFTRVFLTVTGTTPAAFRAFLMPRTCKPKRLL